MYVPTVNNIMTQKEEPFSFLNVDPFPFTNANLDDPLNMLSIDDEVGNDAFPPFTKKPLSKAERRAEHNAIERARRESLNNKFQQLARALPNLMNNRRPSKYQIVEKALDWVKKSMPREERYRYQITQLQKENKKLLAQLLSSPTLDSLPSLSASISTPTPSNHRYHTYDLQQQQQHHHLGRPSVSTTTTTESFAVQYHHLTDFSTTTDPFDWFPSTFTV
ncbi:unnamed protein product [Absidia cylindrospora]